jgi:hypothetical protein
MCPGCQKGLLRHVVGVGFIAEELPKECPDGLLVAIDQQVECHFRSRSNRSDQRDIVIAHRSGA